MGDRSERVASSGEGSSRFLPVGRTRSYFVEREKKRAIMDMKEMNQRVSGHRLQEGKRLRRVVEEVDAVSVCEENQPVTQRLHVGETDGRRLQRLSLII